MTRFRLGKSYVGPTDPTYFIADIAANHDGNLDRALTLIELAAESGADAAKFQNFSPDTILSETGFKDLGGQIAHQAAWTKSVADVYRDASVPFEWTALLHDKCAEVGIEYFTAPYDLALIDLLNPYVSAWKVGSGDITWHESIQRMAATGKPILIATGATAMEEVKQAMGLLSTHPDVVLMQCNTNYTGSTDNFRFINLRVIETFAREFPSAVLGLSDHTPGHATVLGAVALGARVIEKHFTDDRDRKGPDHLFSMEPLSWSEMVDATRQLELALGDGVKRVMDNERQSMIVQRRAVRARESLKANAKIRSDDLDFLRPCPKEGLPPYRAGELVGKKLLRDVEKGRVISSDDVV